MFAPYFRLRALRSNHSSWILLSSVCLLFLPCLCMSEIIQERRYEFPQFQDVSPCPCDLSPGCDTYCCCDPFCPSQARLNHTCYTGLYGGERKDRGIENNCSSPLSLYTDPFFHFLCVHQENSPYLGHFYPSTDKLETLGDYEKISEKIPRFESRVKVDADPEQDVEGYREGAVIRTLYSRREGITGQLSLPMNAYTGECSAGPVRFLRDQRSSCYRRLSPEKCAHGKNSVFDHQMYLMDFPGIEAEPTFGQVLSTSNHLNTTSTTVQYYTTQSVDRYISSSQADARHTQQSRGESWQRLLLLGSTDFTPGLFQENLMNEGVSKYEKLPYFANYDAETGECRNIALEVRYTVFWSGPVIQRVEADILLGNITLEGGEELHLNQYFSVKFNHSMVQRESSGGNKLEKDKDERQEEKAEKQKVFIRSGNPGYRIGSPIVAVKSNSSQVDNESTEVGYSTDRLGFRVWASDTTTSLCTHSKLRSIEFGLDSISGCYLRVSKENITSCQNFSATINKIQESLLYSKFVAKDGTLNLSDTSVIRIIYEERKAPRIRPTHIPICQVPATMRITFLYTHNGVIQGQPIRLINGVRVVPVWKSWKWTCRRNKRGGCMDLSKYLLTSEVEFLEIPAVWHLANTSSFWVKQEQLSCEGDICWENILLPFIESLNGNRVVETLEWIVLLLLFIIPSYSFSKF